jgi:hypothetical protein
VGSPVITVITAITVIRRRRQQRLHVLTDAMAAQGWPVIVAQGGGNAIVPVANGVINTNGGD